MSKLTVGQENNADLIDDLDFVTVEGGPHNIAWTHPDEVNQALLDFVGS